MKIGDLVTWHGLIGVIVGVHSFHKDYFNVMWALDSPVSQTSWRWQRSLEAFNENR